jgi:PIN domain nuclease of toxin-antitoxin system
VSGLSRPSAVLLDTCALIYLADGAFMTVEAKEAILQAAHSEGILVSPVSAWEIGLLSRPGRANMVRFLPDAKTWFARVLAAPAIREAPLTSAIAIDSSYLPSPLHGDPADRLLIATARHLSVPIVTRDQRISDYAAAGYVEVIAC